MVFDGILTRLTRLTQLTQMTDPTEPIDRSRTGRAESHVSVSSSVLTWQPQLACPHSTTVTGMKDYHWRELSRIVDVFRRVGRAGGKASLTTSTEGGHWKASLDIQMNLPTAAHPGQASAPTPYSAAPGQDGAAARRRPRRRRGPASAMRSKARAAAHQATLVAPTGGTGSVPPPCQAQAACLQAAGTEEATAVLTPPPPPPLPPPPPPAKPA